MELKLILESILFSSPKPMNAGELRGVVQEAAAQEGEHEAKAFKGAKIEAIEAALDELSKESEASGRSFKLTCVAGAWQFVSLPAYAPWIKTLVGQRLRPAKLSQPALETLAIVAYRQPLTRAEIEQIRGVAVDGVINTLVERELVEAVGRADAPGRPVTYGTTLKFLEYFGLKNLDGLPDASELRRLPIQRIESLVTAEPAQPSTAPASVTVSQAIEGKLGEQPPAADAKSDSGETPANT